MQIPVIPFREQLMNLFWKLFYEKVYFTYPSTQSGPLFLQNTMSASLIMSMKLF